MPTLPADDVWRKDAPNNAALIYSAVSNLLADWRGAQHWLRAGHAMLCECIWGFIRPGGTWTSALMHMWACSKGSHQVLLLQYQCSRQTILFRSSFLGQMHFKLPKFSSLLRLWTSWLVTGISKWRPICVSCARLLNTPLLSAQQLEGHTHQHEN